MSFYEEIEIKKNIKISSDIYDLRFESKKLAKTALPGQFVNIYIKDEAHLLPRPISICDVNGDEISLVYRTVGYGTNTLSKMKENERLKVLGTIGNGYDIDYINKNHKKIALFGGGVGIPPMVLLSKKLEGEVSVFLGYRDEVFLSEYFGDNVNLHIATEDGSVGIKGNVMTALMESGFEPDLICACGPLPMFKVIKEYAAKKNIKTFFSLEERMACGVGVCLGCTCNTEKEDEYSKTHRKRVCVDGPIFDAMEVVL